MAVPSRIDVPKLTSQVGNSALFETLRDMLTRTAAYVREVAAPRTINGPSLLGLSSDGEGYVEEVTLGYGLLLSAGVLSVSAPLTLRTALYTSGSGNFTTGAGVTKIYVTACAGGGGAGGIETDTAHGGAGGGGGGGAIIEKEFTVTGSTVYAYAVGAGGTAGTDSATVGSVTDGGTGGTTSLGALFSLTGGAGGKKATATGYGAGGAPGGAGGARGETGHPATADRSGANAVHGMGGMSGPFGFGHGGTRSGDNSANAGQGGVLLIKWYE